MFLMELKSILTELLPFVLSHLSNFFCIVRYGVCVINFIYGFKWIFLKPCTLVVDLSKMCMRVFDGARINSDKIIAFSSLR